VNEEPKVRPEHAVRPGRADARNLLAVWFVRKSFYGLIALGLIGAAISRRVDDIGADVTSWGSLRSELASPMIGLALGLLARFGSGFVALCLAFPLARSYEIGLSPRTGFGSAIGKWLDRLQLARAFRALRWTHHVRQVALMRLQATRPWLSQLDPTMDIANISLWAIATGALVLSSAGVLA
jgi:hypothetical protein